MNTAPTPVKFLVAFRDKGSCDLGLYQFEARNFREAFETAFNCLWTADISVAEVHSITLEKAE